MLLRISFFQQHKRKWRYIFAAPFDAITVVRRRAPGECRRRSWVWWGGIRAAWRQSRTVERLCDYNAQQRRRRVLKLYRISFFCAEPPARRKRRPSKTAGLRADRILVI